jgi:hypothetical protein
MPALVKRRVGSLAGTREDEETMVCPFSSKNFRKRERTSRLDMYSMGGLLGAAEKFES